MAKKIFSVLGIAYWLLCGLIAKAQDTASMVQVQIIGARSGGAFTNSQGTLTSRLIGDVQLKQGDNLMYCDSAYLSQATNYVEAWGNVRIIQPGTTVESDYLRYNGNAKQAFLKGNVVLVNGEDNLWADQLNYNLGTKIGRYDNGGTLNREGTTLTSNSGTYNLRSKNARFTGEVYVVDPKYEVWSNDLGYNTETKVVEFFALSTVTNPNSVLVTRKGTYDAKNGVAKFSSRSSVKNKEQYLEADRIDYFEKTGVGKAWGAVIAIDTVQKTTLYAAAALLDEGKGSMLAYGKAVMKKVNGEDSFYVRADTFYSAPVPQRADTVLGKFVPRKGTIELPSAPATNEPAPIDTARSRYYIGYRNVKFYTDSMQAVCDSMAYSQADSTIRLMQNPVAWSRAAQITGLVINMLVDSNAIRRLHVPGKAFIVSRSGPVKAQLYDQVQGDTLHGYFTNNQLTLMHVRPNAKSIYYPTDESNRYLGVNKSESREMKVIFGAQKIERIVLIKDVAQTMIPLKKANIPLMKLERFQWWEDRRPKGIQELFE